MPKSHMPTSMQIKNEQLNPCTLLLTIQASPDQVAAGFDKAYRQAAKRIKIPGFRPGTAPKNLVRQYANQEWVSDVARDEIIKSVYAAAVKHENLTPHGVPRIDLVKFDEDSKELEFTAKVPLEPVVEVDGLDELSAQRPKVVVTDDEVQEQIDGLRKQKAERKAVTSRGAQDGDYAVVNIKPDADEGEGRSFMTVVGQTFPGLDDTLRGITVDDVRLATLDFPENFGEKDWAGKTIKSQVKLRTLTAPELPELTDEFAQQYNTESVDDLKVRVRDGLVNAKTRFYDGYVHEQILEQLVRSSTIHAPDTMWEGVADRRLAEIAKGAHDAEISLEDVAKENNMTTEELIEHTRQEAQAEVKRALLISKIFEANGMKISRDELMEQVQIIARQNEMTPEEAWAAIRKTNNLDEVQYGAMRKKVLEYLVGKATIAEVDA